MDGVPFVTQPPIPPGQSQRIHYPLVQNGTFWRHSNYGLQTQSYVAEPFVILDEEQERWADRTISVMLRDFNFTPDSHFLNNVAAGERGGGTAMAKAWLISLGINHARCSPSNGIQRRNALAGNGSRGV